MTTEAIYALIGSHWQGVLLGASVVLFALWVRSAFKLAYESSRRYY